MNLSFNFLGTSESGELSAYKDRFTGFYVPRGMFGSPDAYYYGIDHESYETAATYKTQITYNFNSSTIQEPNYNVGVSGSFFGTRNEEASTYLSLSGRQSSGLMEIPNWSISISGNLPSYYDFASCLVSFNGRQGDSNLDVPSFFIPNITGDLPSPLSDTPVFSNLISGYLYKYEKDNMVLGGEMNNITWIRGHVKERGYLTGEFSLSVNMSAIYYSRAGG